MPKHVSDTRFPVKPGRTVHDMSQSVRLKRNITGQNRRPARSGNLPRKPSG